MDAADHVQHGREAFARRAWKDAHAALSASGELGGEDLERLATAAYLLGDEAEYLAVLERAHHAFIAEEEVERAVRCAFWLGLILTLRGERAQASGWLGRSQRLLERRDCVERGYLTLLATLDGPDIEAGLAGAAGAAEIGRRFGDADLFSLSLHEQGHCLVRQGRITEGLALLDEAMVAVLAGELSPVPTGLVYCSVIDGCQQLHELRRAQEWTAALTRWCEQQEDLVAFTGRCLVHRAEIMQVRGAWPEALAEARQAGARLADDRAAGQAFYRQGELHRLQGDFAAAEQAYREASRQGAEPQPGLALLRLAQGRADAAVAAIRRVAGETEDPLARTRLLPAEVEIMLATGDIEAAASACEELDGLAKAMPSRVLDATVAHAVGAVHLADDDPRAALGALRGACDAWQELDAPYEVRAGSRARRAGLPGARRRGHGRVRARGRSRRVRAPRRGRRPRAARGIRRGARPVAARAGGAAARGGRRHQQGDRRRAGAQRADRRPSREQHPRQAARAVAGSRDGMGVPTWARLTGWNHPFAAAARWVVRRKRSRPAERTVAA